MIDEVNLNAQPPFTRHCGLFAEDPRPLDLQKTWSHDALPQPVPRQPQESDEEDVCHEYTDSLDVDEPTHSLPERNTGYSTAQGTGSITPPECTGLHSQPNAPKRWPWSTSYQ